MSDVTSPQVLPLDDLRVIELGSLLAGPFCGQLLGDFGAEVIKVEDPGVGDPMRQWGREKPHGTSLWWPVVARNKKSVTADLRTHEGQELIRKLVSKADVLLENFRPGTIEKWGLGPEELWKINSRLIITRVTGFGESLIPEWQIAGYQRERTGATLPNVAPSNVYPTLDGEMILIAANQDGVFRRLAGAMSQTELADDIRYATHGARGSNMEELDLIIAKWTTTLRADDLLERLHSAGVPCGRIFRAKDMLSDPHFAAREAIVKLKHPDFGDFAMQNVFPRLSESPGSIRHIGPSLGQHNQEIYQALLGLRDDELSSLSSAGVI